MLKYILLVIAILIMPLEAAGRPQKSSLELKPSFGTGSFIIVQKGAVCPFMGYLISPEGVASIITKFETEEKKFKLKLDTEKKYYETKLKEKDEIYGKIIETNKEREEKIIKIKDEEIEKLKKNYNPKKIPFIGSRFWTGVVIGIVASVAITYGTVKLYNGVK